MAGPFLRMMATEHRTRRTFWDTAWALATGDACLAAALCALAFFWTLLLAVPQAPSHPLSAARWMTEVQSRFGALAGPLRALGLFSLVGSPVHRILLAVVALLLGARSYAWAERLARGREAGRGSGAWRAVNGGSIDDLDRWLARRGYRTRRVVKGHVLQADRWPWAEAIGLLAHVAPLLLLVGLLIGDVWGWRVDGLVGEAGQVVPLRGHGEVTLLATPAGYRADRSDVRLYVTGAGLELGLSALDAEGNPLGLQRGPNEPLEPHLRFRLTEEEPDAYFAIPEAGVIVRISPQGQAVADPLRVQVFRSPSGQLVWEEELKAGAAEVSFEGVRVQLERGRYPLLAAVHDPGYGLKAAALALAGLALVGWGVWPTRRLWLRMDGGRPVGAGDLPAVWVGKGGKGAAAVRAIVGGGAALAAAWAFWSLMRVGVLWDGSAGQMVATLLATLGLAGYLLGSRAEREGEQGG